MIAIIISEEKADLINIIDHMRISGFEPSSVILMKINELKTLTFDVHKCQTSRSQKGWCNKENPYPIIKQFKHGKIFMLSKRHESIDVDRRNSSTYALGTSGSPAVILAT